MTSPASFVRLVQAESWMQRGTCNVESIPNEVFFPSRGEDVRLAQRICARCPVSDACLDFALRSGENHGVWGGISERGRKRIRKNQQSQGDDL